MPIADADSGHVAADGRAELAALALAIAEQVDERHERVDGAGDLGADNEVAPSGSGQRWHRLVAGGVAVAALVAGGWFVMSGHHPARAARASVAPAHAAPPTSPAAALGRAAAQRLGAGGRAVTSFGCAASYDADAATSPAVLPAHATSGPEYTDYMHACMSGMS
ncbi:MAG TPA: hypothetical protein VFH54_13030 [Mycobacteriales bacterium]|nr:hypothetical protein [Mycobacteriales bacterium]